MYYFFSNIWKDTTFLYQGVTNSVNATICNTQWWFAQNMVSTNHWLRSGIETYTFLWQLTLVSTNHALSNSGLMKNTVPFEILDKVVNIPSTVSSAVLFDSLVFKNYFWSDLLLGFCASFLLHLVLVNIFWLEMFSGHICIPIFSVHSLGQQVYPSHYVV